MEISRITVIAAATIPTVSFGNIKPSIELSATLSRGDNVETCTAELQAFANQLLLKHVETLRCCTSTLGG